MSGSSDHSVTSAFALPDSCVVVFCVELSTVQCPRSIVNPLAEKCCMDGQKTDFVILFYFYFCLIHMVVAL